jgi:HD-like signal output (HDOD) protein
MGVASRSLHLFKSRAFPAITLRGRTLADVARLFGRHTVIENLKEKVEETINLLPPLPSIMSDLIAALNNEDVDFAGFAKIVSRDPSMAMNVLKIANSAFFGLPRQVGSVEQAIRMLGVTEISSLCISCGAAQALKPPKGVKTVDLHRFWRHSVATGVIAKVLTHKLKLGRWDNLYLAGLIHDIGSIVLDRFKHDVYAEILDLTQEENITMLEAEERLMGASHDMVGAWLMEKWKFSDVFVDVAKFHHHVSSAAQQHRMVVAIVSLADLLARLTQHGFDGNMNGVIIEDTEAFKVLLKRNPHLADLDIVKFVWDLEEVNAEIEDLENAVAS